MESHLNHADRWPALSVSTEKPGYEKSISISNLSPVLTMADISLGNGQQKTHGSPASKIAEAQPEAPAFC